MSEARVRISVTKDMLTARVTITSHEAPHAFDWADSASVREWLRSELKVRSLPPCSKAQAIIDSERYGLCAVVDLEVQA